MSENHREAAGTGGLQALVFSSWHQDMTEHSKFSLAVEKLQVACLLHD